MKQNTHEISHIWTLKKPRIFYERTAVNDPPTLACPASARGTLQVREDGSLPLTGLRAADQDGSRDVITVHVAVAHGRAAVGEAGALLRFVRGDPTEGTVQPSGRSWTRAVRASGTL